MRRLALTVLLWSLVCTPAHAQTPMCQTLDVSGRPSSRFIAGDELALEGGGFPPNVLVLVTFRQSPRTLELARYKTDAQGAFSSQPRILRIPADASGGRAAIHLASSGGSATCEVDVTATGAGQVVQPSPRPSDSSPQDDISPWFVVWGTLLALGAVGLGYVRYRRWRLSRLERQISGLDDRGGRGVRLGE